jgi:hypothetical protein
MSEEITRIFISYEFRDLEAVTRIADGIRKPGKVEVYFWDGHREPGKNDWEQIFSQIKRSHVVVAYLTKKVIEKAFSVGQEIGFARAFDVPIISLLEKGVEEKDIGCLKGTTPIAYLELTPEVAIQEITKVVETSPGRRQVVIELGERFNHVLNLMNERRMMEMTVPKMARLLGIPDSGTLQSYFDGRVEAPFEIRERFAECFGVCKEWINFGERRPFSSDFELDVYHAEEELPKIRNLKPEMLFVVRSMAPEGFTVLVLRINRHKYLVSDYPWNISSHVGGGGSLTMFSFYKLMKLLWEQYGNNLDMVIQGRFIDANKFKQLSWGEIFPGVLEHDRSIPWWEDFPDIYQLRRVAEGGMYLREYGEEFIKAQKIIKEQLEDDPVEKQRALNIDHQANARPFGLGSAKKKKI